MPSNPFSWQGSLRPTVRRAVVCSGLLLSLTAGRAQTPPPATLEVGPVYTNTKDAPAFPHVRIVLTPSLPQTTLPDPGDLTLEEDGTSTNKASSVDAFGNSGYGVAAAVAVDVSGSMAGAPLRIIRESLYKFVSDARPQDSIGVLTIADDAVWDVPFGSDHNTLQARLQSMHPRGHNTLLYDGLLVALGRFDASLPLRRELTVISDGHDEGSHAQLADVVQMARDRGIAIDTVGLTRSSPQYLKSLQTMSAETGGIFHQVANDQQLQAIISNGMNALKASPIATFQITHLESDGKQHRLGVHWGKLYLTGETHLDTPLNATNRVVKVFKHLPIWAYGALALACFTLIILLILIIRHFSRRAPGAPVQPYGMATYSYQPEPAFQQSSYNAPPAPSHHAVTPPMPNPTPYQGLPLPSSPVPVVAEHKKTRVAGLFDAGPSSAKLTAISGSLEGHSFLLPRDNFWIGAATGNQVVIADDATVSGRHAYLFFEGPILILADNQSTNGTRINGQVVRGERRSLQPGDQIEIGRTIFRLDSLS